MSINRLFRVKRDFSAARGYQFHSIAAAAQHKKELCMTHREMRAYWGHADRELYGRLGCRTQLLKYRIPTWSQILKRRRVRHV